MMVRPPPARIYLMTIMILKWLIDWQVSNVRMGRQKSLLDHCSMLNGDWMIDLKMKPHWFIIAPDIQLLKKPDIRPNMQLGLNIRGQQLSHTRNANGTDVCLCLLRRTKHEFVKRVMIHFSPTTIWYRWKKLPDIRNSATPIIRHRYQLLSPLLPGVLDDGSLGHPCGTTRVDEHQLNIPTHSIQNPNYVAGSWAEIQTRIRIRL